MADKISPSQLFLYNNRKDPSKLGAMIMSRKLLNRLFIIVALVLCSQGFAEEAIPAEDTELFEMSIEQLMEVEVDSTATLTEANPRLVPAAVTTITEEQIRASFEENLIICLNAKRKLMDLWERS